MNDLRLYQASGLIRKITLLLAEQAKCEQVLTSSTLTAAQRILVLAEISRLRSKSDGLRQQFRSITLELAPSRTP